MSAYPTKRFEAKPYWHLEIIHLTIGRARITHTDGAVYIEEFW